METIRASCKIAGNYFLFPDFSKANMLFLNKSWTSSLVYFCHGYHQGQQLCLSSWHLQCILYLWQSPPDLVVCQDSFLLRVEANSQLRHCSPKGSDSGTHKKLMFFPSSQMPAKSWQRVPSLPATGTSRYSAVVPI